MKRKCVMDTNVLISGVLWRGPPFHLLARAEERRLTICSSLEIMGEVYRVLYYPKFQKYIDKQRTSPGELFEKIESLCTIVHVDQSVTGVCPDPDDEKFLACALASGVTVLISGDKHLLNMKQYESVRILTAKTFYKKISVTC